jgi:NitT/TauT family transport system ATP-binding protein
MRLTCLDLTVRFESRGQIITALEGLSLETHGGEFLSLIGPSGCGKTTLLRTIAGVLKPARGRIEFDPGVRAGNSHRLMVYQEDSLFPWMTVIENAAFGLEMKGMSRHERTHLALELIGRHGLQGREDAYPHQLSAGMKQRVAVIRAFLSEPALLLMDEPFGALDTPTRFALQTDLLDLWTESRRPVLFVTHDVDEAIYLSDRVLVLSPAPGRVVDEVVVGLPRDERRGALLNPEFLRLKSRILAGLDETGAGVAPVQENHAA